MDKTIINGQGSILIVSPKTDECCICFSLNNVLYLFSGYESVHLSITNVTKDLITKYSLQNDLIQSPCRSHYFCVNCLIRHVTDYENHPINAENSSVFCPYPFATCQTSIGFRHVIEASWIQQVLSTDEFARFSSHISQYRFPGFEVVRCPGTIFCSSSHSFLPCNSEILVDINDIQNTRKGELIIYCDQNINCSWSFCFHCKQRARFNRTCDSCLLSSEHTDRHAFNMYFVKSQHQWSNSISSEFVKQGETNEFESPSNEVRQVLEQYPDDFLYRNHEITVEIAVDQVQRIIDDIFTYFTCPICHVPLLKTERCNAISHHSIERCFSCGRIGEKYRGLGDHWNTLGIQGCYRFPRDMYLRTRVPDFVCEETICHSHELGECTEPSHLNGIKSMEKDRVKNLIYHTVKSLLPKIKYEVLDSLYDRFENGNYYDLLPYAFTFMLLEQFPSRLSDCSETIVYEQLFLETPDVLIGSDKKVILDMDTVLRFRRTEVISSQPRDPDVSAWRQLNSIFQFPRLPIPPPPPALLRINIDVPNVTQQELPEISIVIDDDRSESLEENSHLNISDYQSINIDSSDGSYNYDNDIEDNSDVDLTSTERHIEAMMLNFINNFTFEESTNESSTDNDTSFEDV